MSEGLLIHRARKGDQSAWRKLVSLHQAEVYTLAYLTLGEHLAAMELTRETLLLSYQKLHLYLDDKQFRPWLLARLWEVTDSGSRPMLKLRRGFRRIFGKESHYAGAEQTSPDLEEIIAWAAGMERQTRRVFQTRCLLGLSLAESAQCLNLPAGQVRRLEKKALARMKVDLGSTCDWVTQFEKANTFSPAAIRSHPGVNPMAEIRLPNPPDLVDAVSEELTGNGAFHFRRRPLVWTAAALAAIGIMLLGAGTLAAIGPSTGADAQSLRFDDPRAASRATAAYAASRSAGQSLASLDLAGRMSLAKASELFPFAVLLPPDIRPPDQVFLQGEPATGIVLLWFDSNGDQELALQQVAPNSRIAKLEASIVGRPLVNGEPGLWLKGAYSVLLEDGDLAWAGSPGNHLLVWSVDDLGLRLETTMTLDQAIRFAETLK